MTKVRCYLCSTKLYEDGTWYTLTESDVTYPYCESCHANAVRQLVLAKAELTQKTVRCSKCDVKVNIAKKPYIVVEVDGEKFLLCEKCMYGAEN